jgi:AraC-like DNA-binding protein
MGAFLLYKILIVENELYIARQIKESLNENHFNKIFIAIGYDAAINSIESFLPQLVIIDVNLEGKKNGIYLAYFLLKNYKSTPFIFITSSYVDNVLLDRIVSSKPFGFISKPFQKYDIIIAVKIAFNILTNKNIDFIFFKNHYITDMPYVIKKVINYIDKNINNKIEIEELVNLTNWKKHHFIRTFSDYIGITPYHYVLISKIEQAKILLADEKLKLEFIAYDLGFQSYVNFARTFKNYTLLSPKEYRNKIRLQYNNN